MKILVIEDDAVIRESLCEMLSHWGYLPESAADGQAGWELLQWQSYDLVLLDLNLPRLDGMELCRRLRRRGGHQPLVLMLTARDTLTDTIEGLQEGADDYLVKPFDPVLLQARLQALLRRASRPLQSQWQWGPLTLAADGGTASYGEQELHLTPKEHLLLEELLKADGRARSKEQLIQAAWSGLDSPGEESVKTHIKNLRAKLSAAGAASDLIETVYGVGFRLRSTDAA
jgi:DNA-binding response OmpR family regulator